MTLTLAANPSVVAYGKPVTLSGPMSTKKANQQVVIQATGAGPRSRSKAATVRRPTANGAYRPRSRLRSATTYPASYKNDKSPPVVVGVKPLLELKQRRPRLVHRLVTAARR